MNTIENFGWREEFSENVWQISFKELEFTMFAWGSREMNHAVSLSIHGVQNLWNSVVCDQLLSLMLLCQEVASWFDTQISEIETVLSKHVSHFTLQIKPLKYELQEWVTTYKILCTMTKKKKKEWKGKEKDKEKRKWKEKQCSLTKNIIY